MNSVSGEVPFNPGVDNTSQKISMSDSDGSDSASMITTGTFEFNNKTYKVTVTYNKDYLLEKGVDENQIDKKLEDLINEIGKERLSKLGEEKVSISWSDSQNEVWYKNHGGHKFKQITKDELDALEDQLASTIRSTAEIIKHFDWAGSRGLEKFSNQIFLKVEEDFVDSEVFTLIKYDEWILQLPDKKQNPLFKGNLIDEDFFNAIRNCSPEEGHEELIITQLKNAQALEITDSFIGDMLRRIPDEEILKDVQKELLNNKVILYKDFAHNDSISSEFEPLINVIRSGNKEEIINQLFKEFEDLPQTEWNERARFFQQLMQYSLDENVEKGVYDALKQIRHFSNEYGQIENDLLSAILNMDDEEILSILEGQSNENEVINQKLDLLFDAAMANRLRRQLKYQYSSVVSIDDSQGNIGHGLGDVACGSICGIAILKLIENDNDISEEILRDILLDGIAFHNETGEQTRARIFENEVFPKLNDERNANLEIETADYELFPFEEGKYTVLTCNSGSQGVGHTLLLFRKDDNYYLFNSLNREEDKAQGIHGAYCMGFDNSSELQIYLEHRYPSVGDAARQIVRVWSEDSTQ